VAAVGLREVDGSPAARWDRPLAGHLDQLVVRSQMLKGNPLGDPIRRELYVYRPPPAPDVPDDRLPAVYVLQGFGGRVEERVAGGVSEPTLIERLDATFADGDCPPALVVFVDAWTSRGTSQFLNSASVGRYLDYLCDEVVPFVDARYPTAAVRDRRGVCGTSSGGYGATVTSMLRPHLFGAMASHAGDALFECCYQPLFPTLARELRDRFDGSLSLFRRRVSIVNWRDSPLLFAAYGTACAYTPDPERPGEALLPFELSTGRPIEELWRRWLELDPVRMAAAHADALRDMKRIHLDAGRHDEFFLDLGAQALSDELSRLGVAHTLELHDGTHEVADDRRASAIRELVLALSEGWT
jgi:Putative esterase